LGSLYRHHMKNAARSGKKPVRKSTASKKAKASGKSMSKVKVTAAKTKSPQKTEVKTTETKSQPAGQTQKEQGQHFDKAMTLFHKRDFAKAKEPFEKAALGPAPEIAHTAKMHLRICERQLATTTPPLKTPDDHYNYGVALMNRGDLENASQHLKKAVSADPKADHYHYALSLCSAMQGEVETSAEHLKKAIALAPENRVAARNDSDFQAVANRSPLREVLYPERSGAGQ
jgi:tetratricopeptide (TPR) repeat protein